MAKNDKIIVPTPLLVVLTVLPVLILIFGSLALISKAKTRVPKQGETNFFHPQPDTAQIVQEQEARYRESANLEFEQTQARINDQMEREKISRDFNKTFR